MKEGLCDNKLHTNRNGFWDQVRTGVLLSDGHRVGAVGSRDEGSGLRWAAQAGAYFHLLVVTVSSLSLSASTSHRGAPSWPVNSSITAALGKT